MLSEEPRYTYQPPKDDGPFVRERPKYNRRAETFDHTARRRSSSRPLDLQSSRTSSSPAVHGRHDDDGKPSEPRPWDKAKKIARSRTATNTAEIAMFGLLALSKAL